MAFGLIGKLHWPCAHCDGWHEWTGQRGESVGSVYVGMGLQLNRSSPGRNNTSERSICFLLSPNEQE